MTYLDYIVQFQRLRRQQPFPSTAADLYYHLLWVANSLGWKNPFNEGSSILMASLCMTDKTLTSARDKLVEAGLIRYVPGKKGTFSTYELLNIGQNATEILRSIRGELGRETGNKKGAIRGESGGLRKSKIKSKKKESNDSNAPGKNSTSLSGALSLPAEPWAVWVAEHTPTVQRLKTPLTGEQYAKMVADFGESVVREVLQAMENKADLLKKYTSANLTAHDWCKRRGPQRPARPAASPMPSRNESLEPELNSDFVTQRQARQEAELLADRRRRRESQAITTSSQRISPNEYPIPYS